MRKKMVAGNWKMNLDMHAAIQLARDVKAAEHSFKCEVVLIPSFIFLEGVNGVIKTSKVRIGAQNCSERENGAFTGEVSAAQLKSDRIEYVIIGHSERREHYGELNEMLRKKLKMAFTAGLKPIFCCGEPLEVREKNEQENFVLKQLQESVFGFKAAEIANLVLAYEPVWAIGTGKTATAAQAQEMHAFIRKQFAEKYSVSFADNLPILYGGSCKPSNASELFSCPDVDGGLIGGASLIASDFVAIIDKAS
jgi:triosephosphate isomerase